MMLQLSLVTLSSNILRFCEITKKSSSTFAGMTIHSTNSMLEGMPAYCKFDGLKTGTTDKAGIICQHWIGGRKGMRIITVVLTPTKSRYQILTLVYSNFSSSRTISHLISFQTIVVKATIQIPVYDGKQDTVTSVMKEDIKLSNRPGRAASVLHYCHLILLSMLLPRSRYNVKHLTYDDKDLVGQGYHHRTNLP